jgi:hypothetical protein
MNTCGDGRTRVMSGIGASEENAVATMLTQWSDGGVLRTVLIRTGVFICVCGVTNSAAPESQSGCGTWRHSH